MTPAALHRWNQSWTVLLGPNLRGSCSHWQPVRIRKMMPLSAARQSAVRRPVGFLGQNSKRMGRIFAHRSSGISQIVPNGLVLGFRRGLRFVVVMPGHSFRHALKRNSSRSRAIRPVLG
jgi:hypothetical protein